MVITLEQKGFLRGRSLISNVLDVDEALLQYSLAGYGSMALFYDFKAAFPSVEHKLLHSYFEALRWPTWLLWFIQMLYSYNYCFISLRSGLYAGFTLTRGVRQGCPLSPLLFAVVSELLLRRLQVQIPRSMRRAYADDLAMVLRSGLAQLRPLSFLFS